MVLACGCKSRCQVLGTGHMRKLVPRGKDLVSNQAGPCLPKTEFDL